MLDITPLFKHELAEYSRHIATKQGGFECLVCGNCIENVTSVEEARATLAFVPCVELNRVPEDFITQP